MHYVLDEFLNLLKLLPVVPHEKQLDRKSELQRFQAQPYKHCHISSALASCSHATTF